MNKNIPPTKTCKKCKDIKNRSEFISIHVCADCTFKEIEQRRVKKSLVTQMVKASNKAQKKANARVAMHTQLAFDAWNLMRKKDCTYCMVCENKGCTPEQMKWCRMQEAFMLEPDAKKREPLIWDFIMSFQDAVKSIVKAQARYRKYIEVDDAICHINLGMASRFNKMIDEGTYGKKTNLRGYLFVCIRGEIIRLLKTNGTTDISLDWLPEKLRS